IKDLAVRDGFVALLAKEYGDGNAPSPLARYAPIRTRRDHVGDALFAPSGLPSHGLDRFNGAIAQSAVGVTRAIHANEPLLSGSEDCRAVATPAMRIAVVDLALREQRTRFFHDADRDRVAFPDRFAEEFCGDLAIGPRRLEETA